jgi:tRNA1(Val) A37 N6-methylase TrmN6
MELAKRLRPLTEEDARRSFEELQSVGCSKTDTFSQKGNKCLDYFFLGHRLKAKTKMHVSFAEAIKNPKIVSYLNEKIRKIKKDYPKEADALLRQQYNVFQLYYGTINQFRPTEALRVYCALKPKTGILDFSAGWGGRCLAAMAAGIPYYGIDANTNMEKSYKKMIDFVKPTAPVTMKFQPSETVDFGKFQYDLVFTSPPYFTLEEYEKMPKYGSEEGFLDIFFRPVVAAAWKHLKTPGYLALNMPKEMYDAIKEDLPPLYKRMRLPVKNRHATNAARGAVLGTHNSGAKSEGIYIWRKGSSRKTRKIKRV